MRIEIGEVSAHALKILQSASEGYVHSVYRRTVNIAAGNTLLAVQSNSSPLGSQSLICTLDEEQMRKLPIRPGESLIIEEIEEETKSGKHIEIQGENWIITLENASVYDKKLKAFSDMQEYKKVHIMIRDVLVNAFAGGIDLLFTKEGGKKYEKEEAEPAVFSVEEYIREKIKTAEKLFLKEKYRESAEILSGCIGLGRGLSPSGDDFLVGVLAGAVLVDKRDHLFMQYLRRGIYDHLETTNAVSRAFLRSALEDEFMRTVQDIGRYATAKEAGEAFIKIGHSSGMDMLCGIFFVLDIFDYRK